VGDIFSCQMEFYGNWRTEEKFLYEWNLQKFMFVVGEDELRFEGENTILKGLRVKLRSTALSSGLMNASSKSVVTSFHQGKMTIAFTEYLEATIIDASCERF
jgi:hypothetical protein